MDGHNDGARCITREDHHVVTANHPIDNEARASKSANNAPAIEHWQLAASHV